jgi:exodeoxyribonuclease III
VPRVLWAEIDREARKGKPVPSDHTPLVIDLDQPGKAFDAGWSGAEARIAARRS